MTSPLSKVAFLPSSSITYSSMPPMVWRHLWTTHLTTYYDFKTFVSTNKKFFSLFLLNLGQSVTPQLGSIASLDMSDSTSTASPAKSGKSKKKKVFLRKKTHLLYLKKLHFLQSPKKVTLWIILQVGWCFIEFVLSSFFGFLYLLFCYISTFDKFAAAASD